MIARSCSARDRCMKRQKQRVDCDHEWVRNPHDLKLLRCVKCGMGAVSYYCKRCGDYTPHVYSYFKGFSKTKNFEIPVSADLNIYKCLKCGSEKTIRTGGSYSRLR
jgi:predicted RNA-binding Zn-ribbon protein involved in translation (DUF1610 family)